MQEKLCLFDPDERYLHALLKYLKSEEPGCSFETFTSLPLFLESLQEGGQKTVLYGGERTALRLPEGYRLLYLSERHEASADSICKYSHGPEILEKIRSLKEPEKNREHRETAVMLVLSPGEAFGKTDFSFGLSWLMSESKNVLYLPFEPFLPLHSWLKIDTKRYTLSELFYAVKAGRSGEELCRYMEKSGQLQVVFPPELPEDLLELKAQEVQDLFSALFNMKSFERIIISCAEMRTAKLLLPYADVVYLLEKEGAREQERMDAYSSWVQRELQLAGCAADVRPRRLPELRPFEKDREYLHYVLFGTLGEILRREAALDE